MKYFPLFLDIENQPVLIVGGGEMALQKLRLLAKTQARIQLIAPVFHPEIEKLAARHDRISLFKRRFDARDATLQRLIYAASEEPELNERVVASGRDAGALVNYVDAPEYCDFITPSIVDRDPVVIAIGTEGSAPILAREIKGLLDRYLPQNFGLLGLAARKIRPMILERIDCSRVRLRLWERLMKLGSGFRRAVLAGDEPRAEETFQAELINAEAFGETKDGPGTKTDEGGSVTLIGAGPGDPDLLTLKALHALQGADVLVIDRLVNEVILDYARRDAKRIYVGKQAGAPSIAQEEINQILVREALTGARVVRVKGGDPNIFGRVQEELAACQLMGIEVDIIPGISAAQAASAAIQLPLTSRGINRSMTFITAATKDQLISDDLIGFMKAGRPFAVYMGLRLSGEIVSILSKGGVDMGQNVTIVENASLKTERVFTTPLSGLQRAVETFEITGPSILFFGLSYDEMGLMPDERIHRYEALSSDNVVPLNRQVS